MAIALSELFVVYYGPQGRNLGVFPSKEEANSFIDAWLALWCSENSTEERQEFDINSIDYSPNPADVEP